jgi:cytochrome c oxidase subunit 1
MMMGTLAYALYRGRRAGHNPWGGVTMEWTVPSPPPAANFRALPAVTAGPYVFPEDKVH